MARPRKLSANTAALFAGNVGSLVLAFLLSIVIGRGTGERGLGIYTTVLAWVFPLIMLAEFGTNTLMTRDLAANPRQTHRYLAATSRLRYRLGTFLFVLLTLGAWFFGDEQVVIWSMWAAAPLILIEPAYGAYAAVFRAHRAMYPIPLLNLMMLLLTVLLVVLLMVMLNGADDGVIVAVVVVNTVTSLGRLMGAWWVYRQGYASKHNANVHMVDEIGGRAAPFAVAGVLGAAHLRLNYLLMGPLLGAGAVGVFAAGMRFVDAARLLPRALFDALLPELAMGGAQGSVDQATRRGVLGLVVFGLLGGIGATLLARPLVLWAYGPSFVGSVPVVVAAGWLLGVALVRELFVVRAYALGWEGQVNEAYGVMLGVGIVAGSIFIVRYGVVGGVIGWVAAEASGLAWLLWRSWMHSDRN